MGWIVFTKIGVRLKSSIKSINWVTCSTSYLIDVQFYKKYKLVVYTNQLIVLCRTHNT